MRKRIKQTISLLLVIIMLVACVPAGIAVEDQTSGTVPVTVTASTPTFSVIVPTTLPIHMDAYGSITCGDITITNNSSGAVRIKDTHVSALNGWTLADYATTTFTDVNKGQHRAAIQLNRSNGLTASGADTNEDFIPAGGGKQTISASAKIPYQGVDAVNTDIVQIIFVLGWHKAIPVEGLTITGDQYVYVGNTITLSATKSPANTTDTKTISWSSSNTAVATVNQSGVVTGVSSGSVTITAACDGISATKAITVFPSAPDSMVGVKLTIGGSLWSDRSWPAQTATNEGSPYGGAYIYSAVITNSLSADALNQAGNITIPLLDGWEILSPRMRVTSSKYDVTVDLGGSNGQYEYYFYWPNFSGPSLWAGDYTFTITYILERANNVYLRSMNITGSDSVDVGSTIQLSAVKTPANTTDTGTVAWSSSDTTVATVNSNGVVTGRSIGTAVITASCNGVAATKNVTVNHPHVDLPEQFSVAMVGKNMGSGSEVSFGNCLLILNPDDNTYSGSFSIPSERNYDFCFAAKLPSDVLNLVTANTVMVISGINDWDGSVQLNEDNDWVGSGWAIRMENPVSNLTVSLTGLGE